MTSNVLIFLETYGGMFMVKLFLLCAFYYFLKAYLFKKNSIRVPGRYLFNGSFPISGGSSMYYPVFEYEDPKTHEKKQVSSAVRTGWPRESFPDGVTILINKKTSVVKVETFAEFYLSATAFLVVSLFVMTLYLFL